jgi:hypothetical protein
VHEKLWNGVNQQARLPPKKMGEPIHTVPPEMAKTARGISHTAVLAEEASSSQRAAHETFEKNIALEQTK